MKKRLLIIILLLCSFIRFDVKASIISNDVLKEASCKPIEDSLGFNVIKGLSEGEELLYFVDRAEEFGCDYISDGSFKISGGIYNGIDFVNIEEIIYVSNYDMYKLEVILNNTVIYELDLTNDISVVKNVEVNLVDYLDYNSEGYIFRCDYEAILLGDTKVDDGCYLDEISYFGFRCIYSKLYKYSNDNKIANFVTESTNPISEEFIINSINCSDLTDGDINFSIENNTYEVVDNYVEPGEYSFNIYATDSFGNTSIQPCVVNVVDTKAPQITGNDWRCSYVIKASNNDLLKRFTYSDESGIKSAEITKNDYSSNYSKPGEYEVECTATDIYGNNASYSIIVTVVDDVDPSISIPSKITISTQSNCALEDFKQYITVTDKIDGTITDYEIVDNDLYLDNTTKYGTYTFTVNVLDKAGNDASKTFSVIVEDSDYPEINISRDYTIFLAEDEVLTEEQIIEILTNIGQITSEEFKLSSDYFNDNNPTGTYLLTVECDGKVYNNTIEISSYDIDSTPPIIDTVITPDVETNYVLIYVIIGVCVLLIGGLGIVIYKKKH